MKWFDRWFYRKARWAWARAKYQHPEWCAEQDALDQQAAESHDDEAEPTWMNYGSSSSVVVRETLECDTHDLQDGLRIAVKKLRGGYVVTVNHPCTGPDKYAEEPRKISYIITDEQDFDTELCKILSVERMHQT